MTKRDWLDSRLSISIPLDVISRMIVEIQQKKENKERMKLKERLRVVG